MDIKNTQQDIAKNETIFGKILRGEIPCNKVYEDDHVFAFHDIAPKAKVHVLLIPKRKIVDIASMNANDAELVGYVLSKVSHVTTILGIQESGFRVISNSGADSGQEVPHLHFHILGGEALPRL